MISISQKEISVGLFADADTDLLIISDWHYKIKKTKIKIHIKTYKKN